MPVCWTLLEVNNEEGVLDLTGCTCAGVRGEESYSLSTVCRKGSRAKGLASVPGAAGCSCTCGVQRPLSGDTGARGAAAGAQALSAWQLPGQLCGQEGPAGGAMEEEDVGGAEV